MIGVTALCFGKTCVKFSSWAVNSCNCWSPIPQASSCCLTITYRGPNFLEDARLKFYCRNNGCWGCCEGQSTFLMLLFLVEVLDVLCQILIPQEKLKLLSTGKLHGFTLLQILHTMKSIQSFLFSMSLLCLQVFPAPFRFQDI